MVFSAKSIVSALFGSALAQRAGQREDSQESSVLDARRYKDLKLLALHYMPDFDERKYWAYGCNCLILGDRPMSDPGFGRPVDKLDGVCKAYKVSSSKFKLSHRKFPIFLYYYPSVSPYTTSLSLASIELSSQQATS